MRDPWPKPPVHPRDIPRLLELCAGDPEALAALFDAVAQTGTAPGSHGAVGSVPPHDDTTGAQ